MKSKKRASEGGISPDLTSFSDIANLLIIFFILTTSLVRPFGRRMDMPASAKPPETRQQDNTPTVRVTAVKGDYACSEYNGGKGYVKKKFLKVK